MLKRQTAPEHMPKIKDLEKFGWEVFDGSPEEERKVAVITLAKYGQSEDEITEKEIDEAIENNYWMRKKET